MRIKTTLLFLLVSLNLVWSQEDKVTDNYNISQEVNINNEVLPFSNYFSEYKLSKNWILRAENIETNFADYKIKEFPLLAKYSFSKKISALFGVTTNLILKNGTIEDVSTSGTLGTQYEFTESFLMEARLNFNLNSDTPLQSKLPTTNSIFKLGAKYKF